LCEDPLSSANKPERLLRVKRFDPDEE